MHQLVHVVECHHVTVQEDNMLIFIKGKAHQLGPGIVQTSVQAQVGCHGWLDVGNGLFEYAALFKSRVGFLGE